VHGTQHIDKQIISSFSHFKILLVVVDKFFSEETGNHFDALKRLDTSYRRKVSSNSISIASNLYALGKLSIGVIDNFLDEDFEVHALQQIQ